MLNLKDMLFEKIPATNPPSPRCHHSAVLFGWNLYVFGGCQINNYKREVFNDLYEIDLSVEKPEWIKLEIEGKTPPKRFGHLSLKLQKYMIIHGGKGSENDFKETYLGDLWVLNTVKKIWTEISYENQIVAAFHAGVIYKNKMLVFGGKKTNKIK